jgi:hypothetical protein
MAAERRNGTADSSLSDAARGYGLGGRCVSGMMISRRPKSRASSENAPGPRKTRATTIAATSRDAILPPNPSGAIKGSQDRNIDVLPKAAKALAIGVIKPMRIQDPVTNKITPTSHISNFGVPWPTIRSSPWASRLKPAPSLRRSRPMPGEPLGKVGNSLRRVGPPRALNRSLAE